MRCRYTVQGTVQGVGFRYFVRRHALRLGLVGWVRNSSDGGVEAEADGSPAQLAEFEAELGHGPGSASVTNLRVEEVKDEVVRERTFEIIG